MTISRKPSRAAVANLQGLRASSALLLLTLTREPAGTQRASGLTVVRLASIRPFRRKLYHHDLLRTARGMCRQSPGTRSPGDGPAVCLAVHWLVGGGYSNLSHTGL